MFKSYVVRELESQYVGKVEEKDFNDLPSLDVLIKVHYSSLNYKDFLSASGNKGVTRKYPHTPGIDASGEVVESNVPRFQKGDLVLVTGYDLGMNTSGGYQEYIRVPAEWIVPLPKDLSPRQSMIIGTAGFTAALSVYKLINAGISPEDGEVLVTGATGGVGSVAVSILSKLGYEVVAGTGKTDQETFFKKLGAKSIVSRDVLDDSSNRPLLRSRWAGVIDTVGGNILSTALKTTQYDGVVTTCGLVQSSDFTSSVFPFILKGVSLLGVDSVLCKMPLRLKIWELLATDYKIDAFDTLANEITLDELNEAIDKIREGKNIGRTIVKIK